MFALAPLLADSANHPPSGWTDKEVLLYVLGAVGGTLFILVPIAWGVVQMLTASARRRVRELEAENKSLKAAAEGVAAPATELQKQLVEETTKAKHLEVK